VVDVDIRRTVESDLVRVGKLDRIATSSNKVYENGISFVGSCRGVSILDCGCVDCCPEDTKTRSRQAESVYISTSHKTQS
jgi:hypothetical protein